jgi:hypothetical protein
METVRNAAEVLEGLIAPTGTPANREASVALTKLEEVVMWANKSISRE